MTKKECIQVYKCMIEAGRELDKISDKYLMAFGERLEVFDNVHYELIDGIFKAIKMVKFGDNPPSREDDEWFDRTRKDQHEEDYRDMIYEKEVIGEKEEKWIEENIDFLLED